MFLGLTTKKEREMLKTYWVNGTDLKASGRNEEDAIRHYKRMVCGNRNYEDYCKDVDIDSKIFLEEIHSGNPDGPA
jgi:hypothetical protein